MRAIAFLVALAGCLDAPPDAPEVEEGLVAHYKMDSLQPEGIAPDATGEHDGVCEDHCPQAGDIGPVDGTFRFGGLEFESYLVIPDSPALRLEQGTVMVWINLSSVGTGAIFSKPFGPERANSLGFLYLETVGLYFETGEHIMTSAIDAVAVGEWRHVAATWDQAAADRHFYLDGTEIDSGAAFSIDWDGSDFLIGKELDYGELGASLDGQLDDLRVYDRALAQEEIIDRLGGFAR